MPLFHSSEPLQGPRFLVPSAKFHTLHAIILIKKTLKRRRSEFLHRSNSDLIFSVSNQFFSTQAIRITPSLCNLSKTHSSALLPVRSLRCIRPLLSLLSLTSTRYVAKRDNRPSCIVEINLDFCVHFLKFSILSGFQPYGKCQWNRYLMRNSAKGSLYGVLVEKLAKNILNIYVNKFT